jgi:hypothetical protein
MYFISPPPSQTRTDEDGVERYVPLGDETGEDAVYTLSTKRSVTAAKQSNEGSITKD